MRENALEKRRADREGEVSWVSNDVPCYDDEEEGVNQDQERDDELSADFFGFTDHIDDHTATVS